MITNYSNYSNALRGLMQQRKRVAGLRPSGFSSSGLSGWQPDAAASRIEQTPVQQTSAVQQTPGPDPIENRFRDGQQPVEATAPVNFQESLRRLVAQLSALRSRWSDNRFR